MDLEEVDAFERALKSNKRFFVRTFSKSEIRYCNSKAGPARHFAGTFAAKEAVVKAVNQLRRGPAIISDFVIVRSRLGVPSVRRVTSRGRRFTGIEVRASISHTTHYAVAVAFVMVRE